MGHFHINSLNVCAICFVFEYWYSKFLWVISLEKFMHTSSFIFIIENGIMDIDCIDSKAVLGSF